MHAMIAGKREELVELCKRYHVVRLEVFGSTARGEDFDPDSSDADFLVEFDLRVALATLDWYFDFRNALRHALGQPVDLIETQAIRNPYRRAAINQSCELVYES